MGETAEPAAATTRLRWLWPGVAVGGIVASLILAALLARAPRVEPPRAVWFEIQPASAAGGFPALSPDGSSVAFPMRNREGGQQELWLRRLDSLEARPLPKTEGLWGPTAWSPDGRFVAFSAGGKLRRLDLSGGPPRTITELPGSYGGAVWGADDVILFGAFGGGGTGIYRVPAAGGTPTRLTEEISTDREYQLIGGLLPDQRRFLYSRFSPTGGGGDVYIGAIDLAPAEQATTPLLQTDSAPIYAPKQRHDGRPGTGYLLFRRDRALLAQPFDAKNLELAGDPTQIAEGVVENRMGVMSSADGILAFASGGGALSKIVRFDRSGAVLAEIGPEADYGGLALSPDESYLAVVRQDPGETDHLWIVDLARGVFSRLNPGDQRDYAPATSHDGRVAFTFEQTDIWVRRANGVGDAELLLSGPTVKHPISWSPDDRYLIYDDHVPGRRQDLYALPIQGDGTPIPILTTAADETYGHLSPDGQWLVYTSDESGRYEIYIRDFRPERSPAYGNEKLQVSVAGGNKPRWSHDGTEIYYLAPDYTLTAVPITTEPTLAAGAPIPLFAINPRGYYSFDVTASGEFIVSNQVGGDGPPPPITVVLDWQAALP